MIFIYYEFFKYLKQPCDSSSKEMDCSCDEDIVIEEEVQDLCEEQQLTNTVAEVNVKTVIHCIGLAFWL